MICNLGLLPRLCASIEPGHRVKNARRHSISSRKAALVATAFLIAATAAQAQTATAPAASSESPESMAETRVGDHWSYEVRDNITGDLKATVTSVVTDISANDVSVRATSIGGSGTWYYTYDRDWNVQNTTTFKYSPHDGTGVRLPLTVGKTWKIQSSDTNTRGVVVKRNGNSKVVAEEEVTTTAGTFKTAKIETSVVLTAPSNPGKKHLVAVTSWYSPAINHWIKRTSKYTHDGRVRENTTTELVDYGRRQ